MSNAKHYKGSINQRLCGLVCALALAGGMGLAASSAQADDAAASAPEKHFKLTFGNYFYLDPAGNYSGQDYNLRYRRGDSTVFVGYYRDPVFGDQTRAGFDTSCQPFEAVPVSVLPAIGVATRGFIGGSLALQAGTTWYGQVGLGRTNLEPFANLNFDPNDALTFAIGHHADDGSSYSLTTVADNRLHTG